MINGVVMRNHPTKVIHPHGARFVPRRGPTIPPPAMQGAAPPLLQGRSAAKEGALQKTCTLKKPSPFKSSAWVISWTRLQSHAAPVNEAQRGQGGGILPRRSLSGPMGNCLCIGHKGKLFIANTFLFFIKSRSV